MSGLPPIQRPRVRSFFALLRGSWLPILNVLLAVALLSLAVLQYRWIEQVTESDRRHRQSDASVIARRIADELRRELATTVRTFVLRPEDDLAGVYAQWRRSAYEPRLIRAVYLAEQLDDEEWALSMLDVRDASLRAAPWPRDLAAVQRHLASELHGDRQMRQALHPDVPALVALQRSGPGGSMFDDVAPSAVVLRLDPQAVGRIAARIVTAEVTGGAESPPATVVPRVHAPTLGRVRYDGSLAAGDAILYSSANDWPDPKRPTADGEIIVSPFLSAGRPPRDRLAQVKGNWRVRVQQSGGGLEKYVAASRRRNLALSGAVLLLLAASTLMLTVVVRRNQRLRAQEAAFVRVMTHELNTPVSIIRSASENLKDGLVDADRVPLYGASILEETDRLHRMIEQVLSFAGSRRRQHVHETIDVETLLESAAERGRRMAAGTPLRIEVSVPGDLPLVAGHQASLMTAFENLIVNAVRHAGAGEWVGVRARREGACVAVTVEDLGPGIREEEAEEIFEPFYRGRETAEAVGAGLGLAIVRQIVSEHGGTLTLERRSPGAAFTITLPGVQSG